MSASRLSALSVLVFGGRRLLEEGRDRRVACIAALLGELPADRLDAVARAAEIRDGVLDGADSAGSRD